MLPENICKPCDSQTTCSSNELYTLCEALKASKGLEQGLYAHARQHETEKQAVARQHEIEKQEIARKCEADKAAERKRIVDLINVLLSNIQQ